MPHFFSHLNVSRDCEVHDVDTKERIERVLSVNTKAGWILVAEHPVRPNAHGHVQSRRIRYRAIHPIYGGEPMPCLFHCYGKLS